MIPLVDKFYTVYLLFPGEWFFPPGKSAGVAGVDNVYCLVVLNTFVLGSAAVVTYDVGAEGGEHVPCGLVLHVAHFLGVGHACTGLEESNVVQDGRVGQS